jgi:hypothetical protein
VRTSRFRAGVSGRSRAVSEIVRYLARVRNAFVREA